MRGKFVAIEGIDGAGKRTQIELLSRALAVRGVPHGRISFPRYESRFGQLVAQFLNGDFGPLEQVDPYFSALLYAGDRLEFKPEMEAALGSGQTILADRYIASNLAHQSARCPTARRAEFLDWLRQVEYEIYGLPREDLVVYLRLPAAVAHDMVARKAAREYTNMQRDIQEGSLRHLEEAARVYDGLSQGANWVTIECFDPAAAALRPPQVIHSDVFAAVESRLLKQLVGGRL